MVPAGIPTSGPNFVDPERVDVSTFVSKPLYESMLARGFDPGATYDTTDEEAESRPGSAVVQDASRLSDASLLAEMRSRGMVFPAPSPVVPDPTLREVPISAVKTKFPEPMLYYGDPDMLDAHFLQVRTYLRANRVDLSGDVAVDMASMFLRGKALDWLVSRTQLAAKGQAVELATFHAYMQALQEAVRPVELTDTYFEPFLVMRQGKRSMREYVAHFNACRAKAPDCMSDAMLMFVFKRGCRDDLRRAITVQRPQTLEEVFTLAVAVSDLHASVPPQGGGQKGFPSGGSQTKPTPSPPAKEANKPTCPHCGKPGHNVDACWVLHPEMRKVKHKTAA